MPKYRPIDLLTNNNAGNRYTDDEINFIRESAKKYRTLYYIAYTLDRSINAVYRKQIREADEDDFVGEKSTDNTILELKLDIIKHVIGVRQAENAEAKTARENKARKEKLLEALAKKQESAIDNMSEKDILAEIEKLG